MNDIQSRISPINGYKSMYTPSTTVHSYDDADFFYRRHTPACLLNDESLRIFRESVV